MFSVIMGKAKSVQGDLLGNRLIWVDSKTLKSFNLSTNTIDVSLAITGLTALIALDWDSTYIYIAGQFSAAPHVQKINRATLVQSNLASNTEPSSYIQNTLVNDAANVYVAGRATNRKYGKLTKSNNTYTSILTSGTNWYGISQNTDNIYLTAYVSATTGAIKQYNKSTNVSSYTKTAFNCYGAIADDNFIYTLNSTNNSLAIYDLTLATLQTGWDSNYMFYNGVHNVAHDNQNIYGVSNPVINSYGIKVLNKSAQSGIYYELKNGPGSALIPNSVKINDNYLFYSRLDASGTTYEIVRVDKSNIGNPTTIVNSYAGSTFIITN